MSIGSNIKRIRLARGLTQKQLGELCGMADSAIRRYESDRGNPTEKTLNRIANALHTHPGCLTNDGNYEFKDVPPGEPTNLEITKQYFLNNRINEKISLLNNIGLQKALEQIELLTKIQEYLK